VVRKGNALSKDGAEGVEQGVEKSSEQEIDGAAIADLDVLGSNPMSSTHGTVVV
jgi:hypothetical protein